jgi:hypothetical protein
VRDGATVHGGGFADASGSKPGTIVETVALREE